KTALNDGPQAGRNRRAERLGDFSHDGGADFKAGATAKRQVTRGGFVADDSERPEIAATVRRFAAQEFGSHVLTGLARGGDVLSVARGMRATCEDCRACTFREADV